MENNVEIRKNKEKYYHNFLRDEELKTDIKDFEYYTSNQKWYSIVRKSVGFTDSWLARECPNKKILDYCCGDGDIALKITRMGAAEVIGIDISDVSIENSRKKAAQEGLQNQCKFLVMDAENTKFSDESFDIVFEHGVLHHLDLKKAYAEIARILKPEGKAICVEAIGHNPIMQHYRRTTLHLRTIWEMEHILCKKDIEMARFYFNEVKILGFFHLASLGAVPFRKSRPFNFILSGLEIIDCILLRLPIIKWQAWQATFLLSKPKKI